MPKELRLLPGTLIRSLRAGLFRRDRAEAEMADELKFHMESRAADLERAGLSPLEAKRRARIEFGGVEGYKERCREARGFALLDELSSDVRYTCRTLRKNAGFTAAAVLSLALGIGVNLSTYAALSSVVLHPFSYPELNRIMSLAETRASSPAERDAVAPANYLDWKQNNRSFAALSAYREWDVNLTGVDRPDHIHAALAAPEFFQILALRPLLGRTFSAAEGEPGHASVVVVSRGFWQTHLASAPDVLGKAVALGGRTYTVIGVMPEQFNLPLAAALWAPLAFSAEDRGERGVQNLSVIGKLRPAVSQAQAALEMDALARQLEKQYPRTNEARRVSITPLRDMMKTETDRFLLVLMCAACFVLLLACTNVSSLQVARVMSRQRELGLRSSLGASYFRIFRQLLTESLVTGLAGGVLGLALAAWDLNVMRSEIPPMIYQIVAGLRDMRINGEVAVYCVALSLGASLLCCVPALFQVMRAGMGADLNEVLKEGGRSSQASPVRSRVRAILVVAEVALAFILLVGAGLMVGTLRKIVLLNLGYDPGNVLTAELALSGQDYALKPARVTSFYDGVLAKLNQTNEVEATAAVGALGLAQAVSIEGRATARPGELRPQIYAATPQYLRALRLPLLRGRWIAEQDALDTPRVVVLSASLVQQYWPHSNPIGMRVKLGNSDAPWLTVVGVAADVKDWFQGNPLARAYVSFRQSAPTSALLLVRGRGDSAKLAGRLRAAAETLDRDQPVYNVRSLQQQMYEETSGIRSAARMMTTYAVIALLLAVSGIYSINSFFVTQRTREFGVRMSLGATRHAIVKMVLRQACVLTGTGLLIGVPLAILLTAGMSHALYNVVAVQPLTFVLILAMLGTAAAVAAYLPAYRAARVDPMVALRHE